MFDELQILYAKMSFKLNTERRMAMAHKLASLLRNDFSLMDALNRLEKIESYNGRKPDEPYAIAMRQWQKNLERGMSFADATKGWLPAEETLLLTSANISDLVVALENIGRVVDGIGRIKRAMRSAIAYPLFLLLLTFGIVVMVGIYLVPPLAEAAGKDVVWTGMANSLIVISNFCMNYWKGIAFIMIIFVLFIVWSLPNWTGFLRTTFDKLPPWNVYKLHTSVGWLMSLSAMVSAGVAMPDAIRLLADNANPYLKNILLKTLRYIANGDNLGVALYNTKLDFPSPEIIGDLTVYSEMNDFARNVSRLANDYLDESVRKMESISSTLNSVGILLVSVIIAWVVLATFQMQDQITTILS
ncbi:MAG: type II secretion system F family protein [Alphaproteobacteria bacterium]